MPSASVKKLSDAMTFSGWQVIVNAVFVRAYNHKGKLVRMEKVGVVFEGSRIACAHGYFALQPHRFEKRKRIICVV